MTFKEFWKSRVLNKDKRVVFNRILKDILFYGLMVLSFALLILIFRGTFDGTIYAIYLAIGVIIVRVVLKGLEEHRSEEFKWFWERMEWLINFINSILSLIGKTPLPLPSGT